MSIYGFSELSCTEFYPKYLEFRHRVFNEILKYNQSGNPVFHFQSFSVDNSYDSGDEPRIEREYAVEYDCYDVPKALHLAYLHNYTRIVDSQTHKSSNREAAITGCLRFLPTDSAYMIKDNVERGIWKKVKLLKELPSCENIYEASRIAVSPHLHNGHPEREIVLDNLVYANVELAVRLGIKKMIGIMYDRVWNSVYLKRGVPINYISEPFQVDDGLPVIIGEIDTSPVVLDRLNERYLNKLNSGIIIPAHVEVGAYLMHYYHVHKTLPLNAMDKISTIRTRKFSNNLSMSLTTHAS